VIDDSATLYEMLHTLVRTYEAPRPQPWAFELPADYVHNMMQGIVGFTMRIRRLEGKCKLSQNRPLGDQKRVVTALEKQDDPLSAGVAALMRTRVLAATGGNR